LTLQLRDVDVDAALLGDRLRSREIRVMLQVPVAHPADGRLRGLRQIEDERDCVQRAQPTTCISWIETLGTFAAAFAALERYHHEEDVIGSRCGRDFGRFRSFARLCWSAHLSRTRRLSVLVGLCRCPAWRADPPLLLAYPALLGRLCLARAPRAHLRLIRSRLSVCDPCSAVMINRLSVFGPGLFVAEP